MRSGAKKIVLLVLVISMLSVPAVTAGFWDSFSDVWGFFITGKTVSLQDHEPYDGTYTAETCGNGFCGSGEDSSNCPSDCSSSSAGSGGSTGTSEYCGDGYCSSYESSYDCPSDCGSSSSGSSGSNGGTASCYTYGSDQGACAAAGCVWYTTYCDDAAHGGSSGSSGSGGSSDYCGDYWCSGSETATNCPSDCSSSSGGSGSSTGSYCGDYWCSGSETATSCPSDCSGDSSGGTKCTESVCSWGDTCSGTWVTGSSSAYCCKGTCQKTSVSTSYCGNGKCESGETASNCNYDCGTKKGAPTTSNCQASTYWDCTTSSECTGIGAKWCGSYCSLDCPKCDSSSLWDCYSKTDCTSASGSWCGTYCSNYCPTYSCSASEPWNCYDEGKCSDVGGSWCGNYCSDSCPTCSSSNSWNCYTESECSGAGANWCGNYCQSGDCPTCTSDNAWNCYTENACSGAGANWCGNYCQSNECPTCSSDMWWNCYDQPSCDKVGKTWCLGDTGYGWCNDYDCPTYDCSESDPWNCKSKITCEEKGAYWCNDYCSKKNCPSYECSKTNPWYCDTESKCTSIGSNWCGNYCQGKECSKCTLNDYWSCSGKTDCEGVGAKWCESTSGSGYCSSSCPTCGPKQPWNCLSKSECLGSSGEWCGNYCSTECPTCKTGNYWNCNDKSSCQTAGGDWCDSIVVPPVENSVTGYSSYTASGWCQDSCPSCESSSPWNCYSRSECEAVDADWCGSWCSSECPTCAKDKPWNCYTKAECSNVDASWCGDWCSDKCPTCSTKQPWNCFEEIDCATAGGNWCGDQYGWCTESSCPTCSKTQPWSCFSKKECTNVEGNWCESDYDDHSWCSDYECPSYDCNEDDLWNCKSEVNCLESSGQWCGYHCSDYCPPVCGDGVCASGEKISNCPSDCAVSVCPKELKVSFSSPLYEVGDSAEMKVVSSPNVDVLVELKIAGKAQKKTTINTGSSGAYNFVQQIESFSPPGKYEVSAQTSVPGCTAKKAKSSTEIISVGYCGDKLCGELENENTCPKDCGGDFCPSVKTCSDGTETECFGYSDRCICKPCLFDEKSLPEGCYQWIDPTLGYVSITCEASCPPPLSNSGKIEDICIETGGFPKYSENDHGCTTLKCSYTPENDIYVDEVCMKEDQLKEIKDKCDKLGLPYRAKVISQDCKSASCGQRKQGTDCSVLTFVEREELEDSCTLKGLNVVYAINNATGCESFKCGTPEQCMTKVPQSAYDKCRAGNGEMVIRLDDNSCIEYAECLVYTSDEDIYVGPIESIPSSTDLLTAVLRLETLKIKILELSDKAGVIYEFYNGTETGEDARYERVVIILNEIYKEIESIENNIRELATKEITEDQVVDIKYSIKYIDVMFKDVLLLALSTGKDIEEVSTGIADECESDGECFRKDFRLCKPAVYYPENENGALKFQINGLENGQCSVSAVLEEGKEIEGESLPYSMECLIGSYSRGLRSASADMLNYCSGNLVTYMETYYNINQPLDKSETDDSIIDNETEVPVDDLTEEVFEEEEELEEEEV